MKGSRCKCGFATTSIRTTCPRCGREMKDATWKETGKVLSFTELQVIPEGFQNPYNTALVEINKDGPKVICWTTESLKVEEEVAVTEFKGKYLCTPLSKTKGHESKLD